MCPWRSILNQTQIARSNSSLLSFFQIIFLINLLIDFQRSDLSFCVWRQFPLLRGGEGGIRKSILKENTRRCSSGNLCKATSNYAFVISRFARKGVIKLKNVIRLIPLWRDAHIGRNLRRVIACRYVDTRCAIRHCVVNGFSRAALRPSNQPLSKQC